MARNKYCLLLIVSVLVAAVGCERKIPTTPVEGIVTKNGKPQIDIEVVFMADPDTKTVGPRATGRTDESGRYRLQLEGGDAGAVPGTHRVLVLDLNIGRFGLKHGKAAGPAQNAKRTEEELRKSLRVPSNFGSINGTPLRATVGTEPLVFNIEIP